MRIGLVSYFSGEFESESPLLKKTHYIKIRKPSHVNAKIRIGRKVSDLTVVSGKVQGINKAGKTKFLKLSLYYFYFLTYMTVCTEKVRKNYDSNRNPCPVFNGNIHFILNISTLPKN